MPFDRDEPQIDIYRTGLQIKKIKAQIAKLQPTKTLESRLAEVRAKKADLTARHAASLARTADLRARLKGGGGAGDQPRDDRGRWTEA